MEGEARKKEKRMIPDVGSSGLSADFRNEYAAAQTCLEGGIRPDQVLKILRNKVQNQGYLVAHYEQRFNSEEFYGVTTKDVRPAIEALDLLADECNEFFVASEADTAMNDEQRIEALRNGLLPKFKKMEKLISGSEDPKAEFQKVMKKVRV